MTSPKKNTSAATATTADTAVLPPETQAAPQPLPEAVAVPAKLPARKKASVKKPAIKKVAAEKPVQAAAEKPAAPEKIKKPKLVRDSFTIPKAEYVVLDELKQRAAQLTRPIKKSELLRAGIKLLAAMPDAQFLDALTAVPAIKTGRPVLEK